MPVEAWGRTPIDIARLEALDFWSRVDIRDESECWAWKLSAGSHGYGQTHDGTTVRLAHRCAYVLHARQQIPAGLTVDHICHNRLCCNPTHLRLLSNRANAADNGNSSKTHCKRGHEFTPENTRVDGAGHRRCIACQNLYNAARYHRNEAA